MTRNSILIGDALVGRARQLLRHLQQHDQVVMARAEAAEFAAELIAIAEAVMADGMRGAAIIELADRRRLLKLVEGRGGTA